MNALKESPPVDAARAGYRPPVPPPPLPGFDHVKRYYDPARRTVAAKILPGEFYVTNTDELITTVLGSCVSACIWDPAAGIGGMNHFMIPGADHRHDEHLVGNGEAARYGIFAMELLVNAILTHGGDRSRLLVKLAGGGRVVRCATNIGEHNISFAHAYLATEHMTLAGEHLGGEHPVKVLFHPLTGRARIMEIRAAKNDAVAEREQVYAEHIRRTSTAGDIEIFWRSGLCS